MNDDTYLTVEFQDIAEAIREDINALELRKFELKNAAIDVCDKYWKDWMEDNRKKIALSQQGVDVMSGRLAPNVKGRKSSNRFEIRWQLRPKHTNKHDSLTLKTFPKCLNKGPTDSYSVKMLDKYAQRWEIERVLKTEAVFADMRRLASIYQKQIFALKRYLERIAINHTSLQEKTNGE